MQSENIETILQQLVKAKSYYPFENGAHRFLENFLHKRGFKTSRQKVAKGSYNLLAEKGDAKEAVLIYVHIDTVPPVDGWKSDPFVLRKENNNYIGLGVFDMKGGAAAFLSILDDISLKNYSLKFAFCIDEEGISKGVYTLINSSFIKNVVFGLCPEACLVPEKWQLPLMITIGGRGRVVLEIKIPGLTRHGAENEGGINAIAQAAAVVKAIKSFPIKTHRLFGKGSFFIRSIHGENEILSIPDEVILEIDYQLLPGETPDNVVKRFHTFIDNLYTKNILDRNLKRMFTIKIKPRQTSYMQAYTTVKSHPAVKIVSNLSKKMFGKVQLEYTKSVADQNALVHAGIPMITIGPLGGKAHQAGEWVRKDSLEKVANFYEKFFIEVNSNKHLLQKVK